MLKGKTNALSSKEGAFFAVYTADEYFKIRGSLVLFFKRRRISDPEFLADETLSRVIKAFDAGRVNPSLSVDRLAFGIAKNVLRERFREHWRLTSLGEYPVNAVSISLDQTQSEKTKEMLEAMEIALKQLSVEDVNLLERYYGTAWPDRKQVARDFKLSENAIRIRISRLKSNLRKSITQIMERNKV